LDPIVTDGWCEFSEDIINLVRDTDVAVRFGFGLIRGKILDAPAHGILSYHPADIRQYRGQGPEQAFVQDDNIGAATIQRLTDQVDAGEVVAFEEIDLSDTDVLGEVWGRINEVQTSLLAKAIENLRDGTIEKVPESELGEYYSHASRNRLRFVISILLKNYRARIRNITR
jgi:methionyl-tRNA formyltransferase